jgi:hypothetical protein
MKTSSEEGTVGHLRTRLGTLQKYRLVSRVTALCAGVALLSAFLPVAEAVTPNPCYAFEQQVFVREQGVTDSHGDSGLINFRHRDLATGCVHVPLSPNIHNAIHLTQEGNVNVFVEAGYIQHYVPGNVGDAYFNTFGEAKYGNGHYGPTIGRNLGPCNTQDCGLLGLRVQHETDVAGWIFQDKLEFNHEQWECITSHGCDGWFISGFAQGVPQSETSRYGGDGTGMSSDWTNLQWRGPADGNWNSWNSAIYKNVDNFDNPQQWPPPCGAANCWEPANWHPCTKDGSPDYPRWQDGSLNRDEYVVIKNTDNEC